MKNTLKAAVLGLTALGVTSTTVYAEEEGADFLGGNFSYWGYIGNERMFRGNSETQNSEIPALQGMITWTHEDTGIYLGYWTATVKFDLVPDVYAESGPYIGKAGTIGDTGINYNVLLWHYMYHVDNDSNSEPTYDNGYKPKGDNYDYTELYIQANKQFGRWNLAGEVVPTLNDWFGTDGVKGLSYQLTPTYDLGDGYSVSATFGRQSFTSDRVNPWNYWDVGIAKSFSKGWKVDLRFHDTNYDTSKDTTRIWQEHYVLGVSKSF